MLEVNVAENRLGDSSQEEPCKGTCETPTVPGTRTRRSLLGRRRLMRGVEPRASPGTASSPRWLEAE